MAKITALRVSKSILAQARYVASRPVEGSQRPSGSGMTGVDIKLLWLILSQAKTIDVNIKQRDISAMMGRVHPDRLRAAFERLRGTDVHAGNNVMPALVAWAPPVPDDDSRTWTFRIDHRLLRIVQGGETLTMLYSDIRGLSSRYSVALYGRFLAWKDKRFPEDRDIRLLAHPAGRAFQMDVPLDLLSAVFGFYDPLVPSEVRRLLVTDMPACPLRRELRSARVQVDTRILVDEISPRRRNGLRIRIADIFSEGLGEINAEQAYKATASAHYRANR